MTENEKKAVKLVEEIKEIMNCPQEGEKPKDSAGLREYRAHHRLIVQQKIKTLIEEYNLPPDTKITLGDQK